jgi:hypothetical protein
VNNFIVSKQARPRALRPLAVAFLALVACTVPAFASRPYLVEGDAVQQLMQGAAPGAKLVVDRFPLVNGDPMRLELERFDIWEPDAKIVVYEADGKKTHNFPLPKTTFYKGIVTGQADSSVALSVAPNGHIEGTIFVNEHVYNVNRGVSRSGQARRPPGVDTDRDTELATPLLVREFDPVEDLVTNPSARNWSCGLDQLTSKGLDQRLVAQMPPSLPKLANGKLAIAPNGTPTVGVSYKLQLAIETDGELWAAFGSDGSVTSYMTNLIAQASVIYQRDASTALTIGTLHLYQNSGTDPWTVAAASGTSPALAELGAYYHNTPAYSSIVRAAVVMLSGKAFFGGVAWGGNQLGQSDFFCGATGASCGDPAFANSYAGPYAFCGSINVVSTTTPDPTATVNGVQYGLPASNYWPLLEVCHELGHNANGPHTHCIALDAGEQTTYNVVGRPYVDVCYGSEPGCYAGSVSAPAEKGTIMSYCHNISVSGFPASRFRFYKTGEANELVLPYLTGALQTSTSTLNATITLGTNLACAVGQTASVPSNASATFSWQIVGGTITSSTTTNSITFTPNAASVTVTVTVTNTHGCSLINSKTTSTQCGAVAAPTNVVATATTATSVSLTWTAVGGATSYQVFRSSDHVGYTQISPGGSPTTNAYTDSTALANTAYLYKVRAVGSGTSGDSNIDLATTVIFTDSTLTAQSSSIKAAHVTELRTAVNAVRTLGGLGAGSYTDASLTAQVTLAKAVHLTDLRTALNAARTACGLSTLSFTDAAVTAQSTQIKAVHITELRNGVK